MMALLAMAVQAQTFEFQYQGRTLADGETVTIAAEEDVFGELACATNPSDNPSNGLILKLLSGSTARANATLEITHNTLGASMVQWCMGGECSTFGAIMKLAKQFNVAGSEQVQFDASGISAIGYLTATLRATIDLEIHEVKIQFTNGESDGGGSQMWWGYFNESEASSLSYSGYLGLSDAATIDVGIKIAGNNPLASGSKITAVRFWLGDDISKISSNLTIWISKTLPSTVSVATYKQTVAKSDLKKRLNEVELTTPYEVGNTDFYIGYSFKISAASYPIMGGGKDRENGWFYHYTRSSWTDFYGQGYGNLAFQVLLDGVTPLSNAATAANFGSHTVMQGESLTVPVMITNWGEKPITSISYTVEGGTGIAETTAPINSLAFNASTTIPIELPADAETKHITKQLTITKVNGEPNEIADMQAQGDLITITKRVQHVPVVEEFTGTWCGWCPRGMVGMKKAKETYDDKVVLIAAHAGDPMECSDYSAILDIPSGYPDAIINRIAEFDPNPEDMVRAIDSQLQRVVVGSISAKAQWASNEKEVINIDTETTFVYSDDDGNYGVAIVLVQDGMKGTGSNWNQANYLSGRNGYQSYEPWYSAGSSVSNVEYNHVAVAAWNVAKGFNNSISSTIQAGEVQPFSYAANITAKKLIQDKDKLSVVALLIDRSTGTIVNAAQTTIADAGETDVIEDITTSTTEQTIYNLAGQRQTTLRRGINIINGKKVIVK